MIEISIIKESIRNLNNEIDSANRQFEQWNITGEDIDDPSWLIEVCFFKLLAISEAFELTEFRKMVESKYIEIKESKQGFLEIERDSEGDVYSVALSRVRQFIRTLESFFPKEDHTKVTKDLLQIIRDIHYVITDRAIFHTAPSGENDVHIRIEGILKCVFPDLKHKPVLTKPIKSFEPDTGIPSLETLIEYKFLSSRKAISAMADEVLADTRGYVSKDWNRFLYVIYETHRFRTEKEWQELLKQSGVLENTTVVVLSGEPPKPRRKKVKPNHLDTSPGREEKRYG
jgi:DNA-directed RNA polymerase subunit F